MAEKAFVTVIIPTYNRAHIIRRAIESALSQTYPEKEIIVVDDGSSDGTEDLIKDYGSKVRYFWQKNAGPGAARNKGVDLAKGDIVSFLDSDDLWLPTMLERQVAVLNKAEAAVPCSISNEALVFADGRKTTSFDCSLLRPFLEEGLWINPAEVLASRFVMFGQSVAIRRSALIRSGLFNSGLRYLEDYDLALRLSLLGPWGFISEPLVVWQQSADSLSRQALKEATTLKETEVAILERTAMRANAAGLGSRLTSRLLHELTRVRRELAAARMKATPSTAMSFFGRLWEFELRCERALSRRSADFPKMQTLPL